MEAEKTTLEGKIISRLINRKTYKILSLIGFINEHEVVIERFRSEQFRTTHFLFLSEKIHQLTRDNYRVRDLDEELLIAKEVSVRLHTELEKSEESRMITEKLNSALKQHLDTLKESFDEKLSIVNTITTKHSSPFRIFRFTLEHE